MIFETYCQFACAGRVIIITKSCCCWKGFLSNGIFFLLIERQAICHEVFYICLLCAPCNFKWDLSEIQSVPYSHILDLLKRKWEFSYDTNVSDYSDFCRWIFSCSKWLVSYWQINMGYVLSWPEKASWSDAMLEKWGWKGLLNKCQN